MADSIKISALDEIASGALDDTAVIPVVDGGTTQKLPISKLKAFIGQEFATDSELSTQISNVNTTIDGLTTSDISEGTNKYYTDTKVKTKLNTEGVISSSAQITILESQISNLSHYTDSDVKTKLNVEQVLSGSLTSDNISDFDSAVSAAAADAGFNTGGGGGGTITAVYNGLGLLGGGESGDVTLRLDTGSLHFTTGVSASAAAAGFGGGALASASFNNLTDVPSGLISGSDQLFDLGFTTEVAVLPNGVISGSEQLIVLGFALTSSLAAGSVPAGTVSGSSQIDLVDTNVLGFDTSYVQENPAALYYTNARVESHLDTIGLLTASDGGGGGGGVSSSAEIVALLEGQQLNFGTASISASYLHIDTITAYGNNSSQLNFSDDSYSFGSDQELSLKSDGNIHFIIDANNDQATGSFFGLYTNNNSIDNSRQIFKIQDDGEVTFNNEYTFPTIDGNASQVLSTDGEGNIYWATTGSSFSADSIPNGTVSGSQQIEDLGFALSSDVAADISSLSGSVETRLIDLENAGGGSGTGIFNFTSSLEVGDKYTTANDLEITGSVSVAGPFIVDGAFGDDLTNKHEFTGSLDLTGSITATDFIVGGPAGVGEPTLTSNTNLNLSASNAVVINSSPLRLAAYLDSATGSLSPQNGDMIYNSTSGKVLAYQNGAWAEVGGGAGVLPQGIVSGALQISELGFLEADNFYTYELISSSTQIGAFGYFNDTNEFNLKSNSANGLIMGLDAGFSQSLATNTFSVILGPNSTTDWKYGVRNTVVGAESNRRAETSNDVTAIGFSAAGSNISGSQTTAVGAWALSENQLGLRNTAVGYAASEFVKTSDNTSLGYLAGRANTDGIANTSIGSYANHLNQSGSSNVAIGFESLQANTSGSTNVAIGTQALYSSVGADGNQAIGFRSLYNTTLGRDNVSIGERAGYFNTTGIGNVFVGNDSGLYNVSGSYNVIIGYNNEVGTQDGVDNQIIIGAFTTGSGANTTTIGNGDTTDTYIAGNVLPIANESYDLGSPDLRFRDLYLSGSTIDLGGTLITRNINGNIEFLDSGSLIQKSIELAAITGSVYVSEKVTAGEAMKLQPQHPLPSGETGMLAVSGSELWFYGVGWGKVTVS